MQGGKAGEKTSFMRLFFLCDLRFRDRHLVRSDFRFGLGGLFLVLLGKREAILSTRSGTMLTILSPESGLDTT